MIKALMHDPIFFAVKSEPATKDDLQTTQNLLDTLIALKDSRVGIAANMISVKKCIITFLDENCFLSTFESINMMSIGCGGCPDLMAMEMLLYDSGITVPVSYKGYDINSLWLPVHNRVRRYCNDNDIDSKFMCEDAINYFSKYYSKNTNVIVISYLLSYLYNTPQKKEIRDFFDRLIENVIVRNNDKKLIVFNDVNSCNRGRDYFRVFVEKLEKKGLHGAYRYMYFDSERLNKYQKTGSAYNSSCALFDYNKEIIKAYHVDGICRSAQLIVEVGKIDN